MFSSASKLWAVGSPSRRNGMRRIVSATEPMANVSEVE